MRAIDAPLALSARMIQTGVGPVAHATGGQGRWRYSSRFVTRSAGRC
ncbi:MAG: hypothetical protein JJT81_19140 [Rubellimicrobium sp.]|nr:hypothetical protein [Rubellimicrobium sp.]